MVFLFRFYCSFTVKSVLERSSIPNLLHFCRKIWIEILFFPVECSVVEEGFEDVDGFEFWESGEVEDEESVEVGEKACAVGTSHTDGSHKGIVGTAEAVEGFGIGGRHHKGRGCRIGDEKGGLNIERTSCDIAVGIGSDTEGTGNAKEKNNVEIGKAFVGFVQPTEGTDDMVEEWDVLSFLAQHGGKAFCQHQDNGALDRVVGNRLPDLCRVDVAKAIEGLCGFPVPLKGEHVQWCHH